MPHNQLIIDTVRELYLGGLNQRQIEMEMRRQGCLTFSRRVLHSQKTKRGTVRPGWIERFGWKEQLDAGSPRHPACMSAKHEQPTAETLESREEDGMVRPRSDETSPSPSVGNARAKEKTSLPPRLGVPAVKTDQPTANSQPPTFESFLKQVSPTMTWDWEYQKLIYKQLERITSGESRRLMIFLPPRHGPSYPLQSKR